MTVKELVNIVNDGRRTVDYIYSLMTEEDNDHKSDRLKQAAKAVDKLVELIESFNVNDD